MGLLARVTGVAVVATATPALTWVYYTRATTFVPFPTSSPDFSSATARRFNPGNNPPVCNDMAVRTVPLDQLQTTDQETLTRQFCQGIWSGPGFEIQRRYLARKYQHLDGRWDHLWEKADLKSSRYNVGTKIADHFEVVERTDEKVVVRCGDSPLNQQPRPSDGLFTIEVNKDDKTATFRLKSIFFNSTPEGQKAGELPEWFYFLHREYAKLWMETSVRKLLK
ncbi:hypothetical protein E2P81_ATG05337 [Venturia nashicola]|uniref:Uncharacterized protein n=1 Tax=Venturia nashicola TaxID=86259 RepID=A0A4Z1NXM4_9PEZI|nr:hypothetical protein E6O75_ATG05471 [Venturia nashicola]TLD32361.1 hypothetical protein E2P81_ATG05337 [Venturia nashicola]